MIKILSAYTENIQEYLEITRPILKSYCEQNQYLFQIDKIPIDFERPYAWYKIKMILDNMGDKNISYLLWMDADSVIINKNFKIESLIKDKKYLYISKDINDINSGVMLIKINDFTKLFFEKVWMSVEFINHIWWEQAAIIDLINNNVMDIMNHLNYVDQNVLNAYDYAFYGNKQHPQGQVSKNSFIFHSPSLAKTTRLQLIRKYSNAESTDW